MGGLLTRSFFPFCFVFFFSFSSSFVHALGAHKSLPDPYLLNGQCEFKGKKCDAIAVATKLRRHLLQLQSMFITDAGIDYAAMRTSREFAEYRVASLELQAVDLTELKDKPEAMPFFMNIYNCMIIHACVTMDMPGTSIGRLRFYSKVSYRFGRSWDLSANDIEHGILRGNRPSPGQLIGSTYWRSSDPRSALALPKVDPRIHFALNCGAKSCPPIRVFSAKNMERALQLATEGFLRDTVVYDETKNVVTVSRILSWYAGDFPKNLIDWICTFLEPDHALVQKHNSKTKIVYAAYDWNVNDSKK